MCVVCEVMDNVWRSNPCLEEGVTPKWYQHQVIIDYDTQENTFSIKMYAKSEPLKVICQGSCKVKHLLKNIGIVSVPLKSADGHKLGSIRFETFEDTLLRAKSKIDESHPHVLKNCMVCKGSHEGKEGAKYGCRSCVCYKCNGTGIKNNTFDTVCPTIKTA